MSSMSLSLLPDGCHRCLSQCSRLLHEAQALPGESTAATQLLSIIFMEPFAGQVKKKDTMI
jgi:hypothetical protein